MKSITIILFSLILISITSCNLIKSNNKSNTIWISAETKQCDNGNFVTDCMQVRWDKNKNSWKMFYGEIEGFIYEKGYEYELEIKKEKKENPPADASDTHYILVKTISKVKK